jgi:hypothetical protein
MLSRFMRTARLPVVVARGLAMPFDASTTSLPLMCADSGRTPRRRTLIPRPLAALCLLLLGCTHPIPADADTPCLPALPRNCADQYAPTYNQIYTQVLAKSCGSALTGGQCHAGAEARGAREGLVIQEPEETYDLLLGLGPNAAHARVMPGNPECSPLMLRLASSDPVLRMPPGATPLPDPVLCSVMHWIAAGAAR